MFRFSVLNEIIAVFVAGKAFHLAGEMGDEQVYLIS